MALPLKILMTGAEAFPYAKVGGLGDVLGSLPAALQALGHDVTLILPRYRQVDPARYGLARVEVPSGWAIGLDHVNHGFGLWRGRMPGSEVEVLFLENDHFFDRFSPYNAEGGRSFDDDFERWAFYQRGCLEVCKLLGIKPDVLHGHDSQSGIAPALLRTTFRDEAVFQDTAIVFTIHNLAYQGVYDRSKLPVAGFPGEWFQPLSPFECYGALNLMKLGVSFADVITTVSPGYVREIQSREGGHGLDGLLRSRDADLYGVLNGIDPEVWSPQRDSRIPRNYDVGEWEGKRICKRGLLARLGLPESDLGVPLVAFVGRLVPQKGCDLFAPILQDLLRHDLRLVVLGSGADAYEGLFAEAARSHPEKVRAVLGFDDDLAHWIEAGADVFLMPSLYEPCGLNQLYSMAYGTVPVVHATGGLADTVIESPPGLEGDEATGFRFHGPSAQAFRDAVFRALVAYQDRTRWERLMTNGMQRDFSWARSARRYVDLYERALSLARSA